MTDMKMQDMKLQNMKLQDKYLVLTEITLRYYEVQKCAASGCYFLRHKHSNALCVSYYLFRKSVT